MKKARKTSLSSLPAASVFLTLAKKKKPKKPVHFIAGRNRKNYSSLTNMGKKMMKRKKKEEKYRKERVIEPTKETKRNQLIATFGKSLVGKVMEKPKKFGYQFEHNDRNYFHNDFLADTEIARIQRKIRTKKIIPKKTIIETKNMTPEQHLRELLYTHFKFH